MLQRVLTSAILFSFDTLDGAHFGRSDLALVFVTQSSQAVYLFLQRTAISHPRLTERNPTHCSDVTLGVTALLRTTSLSDETSSDSSSLGLSLDGPACPVMFEYGWPWAGGAERGGWSWDWRGECEVWTWTAGMGLVEVRRANWTE